MPAELLSDFTGQCVHSPPRARAAVLVQHHPDHADTLDCFPERTTVFRAVGTLSRTWWRVMVPWPREPSSPMSCPACTPSSKCHSLYGWGCVIGWWTPPGQARQAFSPITKPSGLALRQVGPGEQRHWNISVASPRPSLKDLVGAR